MYPNAKAPNTQPKAVSVMLSSRDMPLFAAEIQTRSTMVKNESEQRHATTYARREGPFAAAVLDGCIRSVFRINATSLKSNGMPSLFVIDFYNSVKLTREK